MVRIAAQHLSYSVGGHAGKRGEARREGRERTNHSCSTFTVGILYVTVGIYTDTRAVRVKLHILKYSVLILVFNLYFFLLPYKGAVDQESGEVNSIKFTEQCKQIQQAFGKDGLDHLGKQARLVNLYVLNHSKFMFFLLSFLYLYLYLYLYLFLYLSLYLYLCLCLSVSLSLPRSLTYPPPSFLDRFSPSPPPLLPRLS